MIKLRLRKIKETFKALFLSCMKSLDVASIHLYFSSYIWPLLNTLYSKESGCTGQAALARSEAFLPDSRQRCNSTAAVPQPHMCIQNQQMQGPACARLHPLQKMEEMELNTHCIAVALRTELMSTH